MFHSVSEVVFTFYGNIQVGRSDMTQVGNDCATLDGSWCLQHYLHGYIARYARHRSLRGEKSLSMGTAIASRPGTYRDWVVRCHPRMRKIERDSVDEQFVSSTPERATT